jgi:type VI secretion system protein ImpL
MSGISSRDILRIVLAGIGLTSVCALIYLAGPLISIGGWRPLESYIGREIAILVVVAAFASVMAVNWTRRKKATAKIAEGIATPDKVDDDADVLKDRMKDALATLKTASGGKSDFLYDLPWYVLIGPPGSGKTTALVNSGLKFPLSRGATPAAIAGVGGTRYCDWWFTEEAVMIDTAGRYTTHDSDATADKQSWLAFLDLLKKNRPRQPINGVLVAISLEDLMMLPPADIAAHANAIRARLLELHERLKVDFPVYALFTKGDLVAGFTEYFASQSDQGRRQVWGATFQTDDKTRNLVGDIPKEFDDLIERLNTELTDRLQEEPTPSNRVLLYGFPTQMAALKRPIFDFLNQIFEPTRYHANATLRGFYFTSGTQHGTPIDRLIGALAKSFGAEQVGAHAYSGLGKSFFLTDLILKVIIGEAAWVSTDRGAVRRARIIKACLYSTVALFAVAMTGLWWVSYRYNSELISATQYAVADYARQVGPYAHETLIGDHEFPLPLLYKLRNLPTGYATRETPTPLIATFGLSQRERLQTSAEQVYHVSLERMLRPRLMFRLEEVLNAAKDPKKSNPGAIYEALKVYLMIAGVERADRDLIVGWMRNDFADLYQGAPNAEGRKALEGELVAMLDLEGGEEPLVEPNWGLIEECRRILARLSIADRAYQLLKSQARQSIAPDWVAAHHGGPDFATVFEAVSGNDVERISIPGFYTYVGFQRAFIEKLPTIAEQLQRDSWVLGDIGKLEAITKQFDDLKRNLLDMYSRDFVAVWTQTLEKLRIRPLNSGKPRYEALNAAAASTSPIRLLIESIRDETALTRERKDLKAGSSDGKKEPAASPVLGQQGSSPGASVEGRLKQYHQVVEGDGSRRLIDLILSDLTQINNSLQTIVLNPAQEQQATNALRTQVAQFKNDVRLMPPPFNSMLIQSANSFENTLADDTFKNLDLAYRNQVGGPCRDLTKDHYPFARSAQTEIPPPAFGQVFGGGGYFDSFFKKNLEDLADISQGDWKWRKKESPVASRMSDETLRQFQRAARIRAAFFPGNGNTPIVTLNVTPPMLAGTGLIAKLWISGVPITSSSQPGAVAPQQVQWTGTAGSKTDVSLEQDPPNPKVPPSEQLSNPRNTTSWALLRLLDRATKSAIPNGINASWSLLARDVSFQIITGTTVNPFDPRLFTDFKCPASLGG